jgi:hypothetical protein
MRAALNGVVFAVLFGCGHGTNVALPIAATAAAVTEVALYSLAQHGCLGQCGPGAECNHATGLCQHIPCSGQCPSDEVCQVNGSHEECVPPGLLLSQPGCTPIPDAGSLLLVTCDDGGP